jgi:WD40 repeat protein
MIWDPESGTCVKTLTGNEDRINCLIQLANGFIASGSVHDIIKIWNPNVDKEVTCVKTIDHTNAVVCLVELANGYLASGSFDCTIKIWK